MQNNVIISAPPRPIKPASKLKTIDDLHNFMSTDMTNYFADLYRHMYFIWQRSGGLRSNRLPTSLMSSITQNISNVGNIGNAGSSETDLLQYSLDSNSLSSNDDFAEVDAYGTFAANGNTKQINLYFGSTLVFSSNAVAINSGGWKCQVKIVRVSSNSQKIISCISSDNGTTFNKISFNSASNDLTVGNLIKFTGIATSSGDITQEGMYVKIFHV